VPLPQKSDGPFCRNSRWRTWKRKYCYITANEVWFLEFDQIVLTQFCSHGSWNVPINVLWWRRKH